MTKEAKIIIAVSILILAGVFFLAAKSSQQTTTQADPNLLVRDASHMTGQKGAKVTVVEFGDYQCPACGYAHPIVQQVLAAYKSNPNFNFVFRNFPLSQHQNALPAAEAAEAAAVQGKFWEMHDKLYENQDKWSDLSNPTDVFVSYAQQLGLDIDKFKTAITAKQFAGIINQDQSDGNSLGVHATPTFYINGIGYNGALSFEQFKKEIDKGL